MIMKVGVLNQFVCPACHFQLGVIIHKKVKERVLDGEFQCKSCNKKFAIKQGIACFVSSCVEPTERSTKNLRKIILKQEVSKKWMNLFPQQELKALKEEWEWMISSIKNNKNTVHLDFATGTGRFLRNIVSKTKGEVVVLEHDYSTCRELQYFLKKIKKYSKVSIVCADARNMPFKNETFDSISTWHGLDEPKMEKAIEETQRVLKKGGFFVASGIHYLKNSKSFQRAKKHHINFLTKEKTIKILQDAGFRHIEHKIFYEGQWNKRGDYLPVFNDWYISYAVKCQK